MHAESVHALSRQQGRGRSYLYSLVIGTGVDRGGT